MVVDGSVPIAMPCEPASPTATDVVVVDAVSVAPGPTMTPSALMVRTESVSLIAPCKCAFPVSVHNATSVIAVRTYAELVTETREARTSGRNNAQALAATAIRPSAAHTVSAGCGDSGISSPLMNEIPYARVNTHPITAPPLMTTPRPHTNLLTCESANTPQPTCSNVSTKNTRDDAACSACKPIAAP